MIRTGGNNEVTTTYQPQAFKEAVQKNGVSYKQTQFPLQPTKGRLPHLNHCAVFILSPAKDFRGWEHSVLNRKTVMQTGNETSKPPGLVGTLLTALQQSSA